MAARDLRMAAPQYKDVSGFKLRLKHVAGLPRNTEPGISHMVVTPDGEELLTINSNGRLELWRVRGIQKKATLKLGVDVIDMALRTADKVALVSTKEDVREIRLVPKLEEGTVYPWILKDLKYVVLFPEQGRGLFPYQKTGTLAGGAEGRFWILALESFLNAAEDNSPDAPLGGDEDPDAPPEEKVDDPGGKPAYASDLPTGVMKVQDSSRPVDSILADRNGFIALVQRTTKVDVADLTRMTMLGSLATGAKGNQTMALSTNGMFAATGGRDRYIRVWDTKTQKMVKIFHTRAGVISLLRFSPDSQILASYTLAGRLQFWDMGTDKLLQEIKHHDSATVLKFTPDQLYFLVGNANSTITVYERK
jgi:WD40 repeat protein